MAPVIGRSYTLRSTETPYRPPDAQPMMSMEIEEQEESNSGTWSERSKSCCQVFYEEENCSSNCSLSSLICCASSPSASTASSPVISQEDRRPNHKDRLSTLVTTLCSLLLSALALLLVTATLPLSLCFCLKVAQEYERCVVFRLGRLRNGVAAGPGVFFVVPCIDEHVLIDLRTIAFDVPPQEILSRDSVTVTVNAVVYYRVSEPVLATNNVEDYRRSTHLLAATTLRNVLGTKVLAEILSEREAISHVMEINLDEATDQWGVKVERVEIKDVRLPVQLQRSMAAEAEAAREARAKVIKAEGEQKASKALKEAAAIMEEKPSALQLRYLQTLGAISGEKNSTIIFPVPINLLKRDI